MTTSSTDPRAPRILVDPRASTLADPGRRDRIVESVAAGPRLCCNGDKMTASLRRLTDGTIRAAVTRPF